FRGLQVCPQSFEVIVAQAHPGRVEHRHEMFNIRPATGKADVAVWSLGCGQHSTVAVEDCKPRDTPAIVFLEAVHHFVASMPTMVDPYPQIILFPNRALLLQIPRHHVAWPTPGCRLLDNHAAIGSGRLD